MAQRDYSFLDIAVLDEVRDRFAAADAIAILSTDLTEVIWANGPGAELFGHTDIESIMGAEAGLPFAARRQIMATSGFPEIGSDRPLTVRLASGMTSRTIGFLGSRIALPGGEAAILLAVPFAQGASRTPAEIAARAIGGFGEAGHHVALVDGRGRIEAASQGFDDLGIPPQTLEALAAEAVSAEDRLVKRLITAGTMEIAAGVARLRDDPPLSLFVAIGTGEIAEEEPAAAADAETAAPPTEAAPSVAESALPAVETALPAAASEVPPALLPVEPAPASSPTNVTPPPAGGQDVPAVETIEAIPPAFDTVLSAEPEPEESAVPAEPAPPAQGPRGHDEAGEDDRWYFGPGHDSPAGETPASAVAQGSDVERPTVEAPAAAGPADEVSAAETPAAGRLAASIPPSDEARAMPRADRAAAPVRFVWRTDAGGRFSAISDEFADVVGAAAADVVGRTFADVAAAFALDPGGEIAGLLERRDTWSGRSVLWPIADTDLRVPVDLAALPIYGRSRNFEGFRGFGVARTADAVVDPEATGLSLARTQTAEVAEPTPDRVDEHAPTSPEEPIAEAPAAATTTAEPVPPVSAAEPEAAAPKAAEPVPPIREEAPRREDPFKGEVPALTLVPKPERRFSDKIIRLAEHRQPANDKGLTPVEKNAFREIGDRLKKEGSAPAVEGAGRPATGDNDQPPAQKAAGSGTVEPEAPESVEKAAGTPGTPHAAIGVEIENDGFVPTGPEEQVFEAAEPQPAPDRDDEIISADDRAAEMQVEPEAIEAAEVAEEAEKLPEATAEAALFAAAEEGEAPAEPSYAEPQPAVDRDDEIVSAGVGDDATGEPEAVIKAVPAEPAELAEEPAQAVEEQTEATTEEVGATAAPEENGSVEAVAEDTGRPPERTREEPARVHDFLPSAFASAGGAPRPAVDTSILDKLPVPVLIHSGDVLHYANREFLEFTAYDSVEELAERGGLGVLFGDPYRDEGENDRADRKMRLRRGDGLELPVEALLQSVPWGGGKALLLALRKVGRMPVLAPAATFTVEDKNELEARVAELRTIIDTATDGVVLIANDGTIRSISRPAEALFGVENAEVAGKPFTSLFAIESQRAARDYLNGLSENGVASVLNDGREVIGREAQGRFIPLFMTIGKLPNLGGYCAVVRDITQWKRAEEELTQSRAQAERASSQKTDFLARVSHEIRTPLNAIIGFSELMMDEKFGPIGNDRYRDYLRDINRSGNHVLDLVNDLLDISKIEAGEQEMSYEAVSLNDTLAETVAMMQPQANRERVIIRSSFASRLPEVVADLRSVRQIALNLLSNAIRYTQAGGQVVVSTAYEPSGDVVMRVRDTGIGMTQAEIEQALKPFKQISALKRGRSDGTGLGLPLTKAMVEANRAKFIITSAPSEGTLVEITFPSTRVLAE